MLEAPFCQSCELQQKRSLSQKHKSQFSSKTRWVATEVGDISSCEENFEKLFNNGMLWRRKKTKRESCCH
jgi:hypothetical protein